MSTPQKFEKLQALTGYKTPADVAACLTRNGIKFYFGKYGKPFTTTTLIEQPSLVSNKPTNSEPEKQHIEI